MSEYLLDLNATAAAIRAGYSSRAARKIGCELLTKPDIRRAIDAAMRERNRRTEITADRVIAELAKLAFLDIADAFSADGVLKPLHAMDADTRAAIASFETVEQVDAGGVPKVRTRKFRFADKLGALGLLMKHLGMFDGKETEKEDALVALIRHLQGTTLRPVRTPRAIAWNGAEA